MKNVKTNNVMYLYMYSLTLMHLHLMSLRHAVLSKLNTMNTHITNVVTHSYGNSPYQVS